MQSCYTEANVCVYKMIVEKGIFHVLSYQAESVGIIRTVGLQQDIF